VNLIRLHLVHLERQQQVAQQRYLPMAAALIVELAAMTILWPPHLWLI
jgi:hypothetical protein